ncbi:YrhB domain-containing protein [Micromonospora echinospora]
MVFQDAYEAAQRYLDANVRGQHPLEIVIASCSEYANFWVFGYNTRRFLLEMDFMASLAGNGPIVVPKNGDELFLASSATPLEEQLPDL